jgi:signal transduction histidine kinase
MLCVLREDDVGTPIAPSPRLNGLAELVEVARAAGLTVELDVHGDLDGLPDGVSLCAYRVVQEALTNTMRHARARTACVGVRRTPGLLVLEVCDDGTAAVPGGTPDRPGHGLLGMRERVHVFGGQLEHGPAGSGGYRVHARLPLHGQAP